MGSITDTPLSTSIPNFSTNLTSNDASNPSSSTHQVESQLHSNLPEEVGYEQGDYNEFIEGVPNIVDEAFQKTNNVVQSPIQNLNVTPSISHERKCTPKRIQVDESALSSMEVRCLNVLSVVIVQKLLDNILNPNLMLVNVSYF